MSSPTWSRPRRWLARAPQDCVDPGDRDLFVVKRLAQVVVGAFGPFRRARLPTPTPNGQRQVPPRRPGGLRPYDLRHSFASLLFHEGHLSIVEIAAQARPQPDDDTRHLRARDRRAKGNQADFGGAADQAGERVLQSGPQKDPTTKKRPPRQLQSGRKCREARSRTRTDDPFLTMEVRLTWRCLPVRCLARKTPAQPSDRGQHQRAAAGTAGHAGVPELLPRGSV